MQYPSQSGDRSLFDAAPRRHPVVLRNQGRTVCAEYRNGDQVLSEAMLVPLPDGWVVDGIATHPAHLRRGYARAILEAVVAHTGSPVRVLSIDAGAESFWYHMTELKLAHERVQT